MNTIAKLTNLLFAATCIREIIDVTEDPKDLNHLARLHLGITDFMETLKERESIS
jgi:hypothetical protein